jgi:hypothetical protein
MRAPSSRYQIAWCVATAILHRCVGAVHHQQPCGFNLTIRDSRVKGSASAVILAIHSGAIEQKELHQFNVTISGRPMESAVSHEAVGSSLSIVVDESPQ